MNKTPNNRLIASRKWKAKNKTRLKAYNTDYLLRRIPTIELDLAPGTDGNQLTTHGAGRMIRNLPRYIAELDRRAKH